MAVIDYRQEIDQFEEHYRYDSTYMRELLETSPEGYAKFHAFQPLASHRERLSRESFWVAKLAAMKTEDCGHCLQLNVRLALEDNIPKPLIEAVLRGGDGLPAEGQTPVDTTMTWFNGSPGLVARVDGSPVAAFNLEIRDGRIEVIHALRNPDKLRLFGKR